MDGLTERIVAALLITCFYLVASGKLVAVLQQCGYENRRFVKWYLKKENMFSRRLANWSFLSAFSTLGVALAFCFLDGCLPLVLSAIPFFFFCILFYIADKGYALKVPYVRSGRVQRLTAVYALFIALAAFLVISLCSFLGGVLVDKAPEWLLTLRYFPVSFLPLTLPWALWLANAVEGGFERARNQKFVNRAAQKLKGSSARKVAIVGSYGKTTVKSVLDTLLSVKYAVKATPLSYNTPIGVAKTVFSDGFDEAEILLIEMGARRKGDIRELCEIVSPETVVFTGVCAQHIETFGDERAVLETKCEALHGAKRAICGESLRERIASADFLTAEEKEKCIFVSSASQVKEVEYLADKTRFTLCLTCGEIEVETRLLGEAAVENLLLCATAAEALGLTREEIEKGLSLVTPVAHRLELSENGGIYILDDGYNANEKGAALAIKALCRFEGKKFLITPGIVETGVLHAEVNEKLGEEIAKAGLDGVALVGGAQVKAVWNGYLAAGGDEGKISIESTLEKATKKITEQMLSGDAVLFLNDLPDAY